MQTVINNNINSLVKTLQAQLPMNVEHKARLDKKIRLEFNYNSNHIEGNTLTYGETELLLIFDKTTGNHELREYEEMKAHDVVFELIKEWALDRERTISEIELKNVHQTLLVRPFWKEAITADGQATQRLIKVGSYKEYPNHVRLSSGEMFLYASVEDTPVLMGELMEWYRKEEEKKELYPVALAALLHYKFVRIHPFDDGNGRLSRLLMNYVLLKHDLPPVVIKSAGKKEYLFALNQADAGDVNAFIKYIGEQMIWSLELSIKAARDEEIEEEDDLDKEIKLLKNLKHESQLSEQRTVSLITQTVVENLIPLFKMIEQKCSELKELFFNYERTISCRYLAESNTHLLGSKEKELTAVLKSWSERIERDQKVVSELQFEFGLNGLKKTINARRLRIQIVCSFLDFNYSIDTGLNSKQLLFGYGKKLSEAELKNIAKPILKSMIESIKSEK